MTPRTRARSPGSRRGGAALALLAAGAGWILPAAAPAATAVPANQPLAVLQHDHVAWVRPGGRARRLQTVSARRPLTGVRTILPVLGEATGSDGTAWLHVRLPGRPSGHTGWIISQQTRRTATEWQITVRLSARRIIVYRDGRADRRFRAVVGKPSTPTPRGRFFIEEALALAPQDAGSPFALATSARSHVLQEFDGGPGQIARHGTRNLSGALGSAASHGCVRLSPRAITWLAKRIGSGIPLTITR
jgi:lipoprotein-anchoring transpeptidase ErfK/SrfK